MTEHVVQYSASQGAIFCPNLTKSEKTNRSRPTPDNYSVFWVQTLPKLDIFRKYRQRDKTWPEPERRFKPFVRTRFNSTGTHHHMGF